MPVQCLAAHAHLPGDCLRKSKGELRSAKLGQRLEAILMA